jgi:hypothetical protein
MFLVGFKGRWTPLTPMCVREHVRVRAVRIGVKQTEDMEKMDRR